MGEDLRMGLDPRDCRLDAAMILGDSATPDNVNWTLRNRDKTCTWLDFIDSHFEEINNIDQNGVENKTVTTNVTLETVSAARRMDAIAETSKVYNDISGPTGIERRTIEIRSPETHEVSNTSPNKTVVVTIPRKTTATTSRENRTITIGDS